MKIGHINQNNDKVSKSINPVLSKRAKHCGMAEIIHKTG